MQTETHGPALSYFLDETKNAIFAKLVDDALFKSMVVNVVEYSAKIVRLYDCFDFSNNPSGDCVVLGEGEWTIVQRFGLSQKT